MPIVVRSITMYDYFPDIMSEMRRSKINYERGMFGPYSERIGQIPEELCRAYYVNSITEVMEDIKEDAALKKAKIHAEALKK